MLGDGAWDRRGAFGGADGAACVDRDHCVGAPRGGERLAHRARRQQPSVAHPALGVHQQQIDVASKAHVLKSVVEHHRVERAHPLFDKLDAVDAPARDRDWAGERFRHHHRLVAGFVRTSEQPLVVGDQDRALRARRAAPPRLTIATLNPRMRRREARNSVNGVLALPPSVRLPTLTTSGRARRLILRHHSARAASATR